MPSKCNLYRYDMFARASMACAAAVLSSGLPYDGPRLDSWLDESAKTANVDEVQPAEEKFHIKALTHATTAARHDPRLTLANMARPVASSLGRMCSSITSGASSSRRPSKDAGDGRDTGDGGGCKVTGVGLRL